MQQTAAQVSWCLVPASMSVKTCQQTTDSCITTRSCPVCSRLGWRIEQRAAGGRPAQLCTGAGRGAVAGRHPGHGVRCAPMPAPRLCFYSMCHLGCCLWLLLVAPFCGADPTPSFCRCFPCSQLRTLWSMATTRRAASCSPPSCASACWRSGAIGLACQTGGPCCSVRFMHLVLGVEGIIMSSFN